MKHRKFLKERIILAVLNYFKFPPENIEHQHHVVPRKLYYHYGNIIAAYPITRQEKRERTAMVSTILETAPEGCDRNIIDTKIAEARYDCPTCPLCENLPCPHVNTLADGSCVCESHRYQIIRQQH